MLKSKLFLIPMFILVCLGATHQIIFSQTPLRQMPELLSTMRAKEFCSCFFMLGKGEKYCLDSVKKGYPIFTYKLDQKNKSVIFENPIASSRAFVQNQKYGCNLE
mgnify:CR=1 FL=1